MSKRLLEEEEALSKIELSLKLNGKCFKGEYLNCSNCKFGWGSTFQRPKFTWVKYFDSVANRERLRKEGEPKYDWYCYNYKNYPYHAGLRFVVVRLNTKGQPVPIKNRQVEYVDKATGIITRVGWTSDPDVGERDTFVLVEKGKYFRYIVCRRFESNGRE